MRQALGSPYPKDKEIQLAEGKLLVWGHSAGKQVVSQGSNPGLGGSQLQSLNQYALQAPKRQCQLLYGWEFSKIGLK